MGSMNCAPAAFVTELLAHRAGLSTQARILAHDRATADDLVQETLERALRSAGQFKPGSNLRAWLIRILRNLFTDNCRRNALARSVTFKEMAKLDATVEPTEIGCHDLISLEDVTDALAEMEPEQSVMFELAYIQQLSYSQIGERLAICMSTVGTRLWRAKIKLRELLEKRWHDAVAAHRRAPRAS